MAKLMAMGPSIIQMEASMKGNGRKTYRMGKGSKPGRMGRNTKGSLRMD